MEDKQLAKNLLLEKRENLRRAEDALLLARERGHVAAIGIAETQLTNSRTDLAQFETSLRELQEQVACLEDL
jgi:hypothetical protein